MEASVLFWILAIVLIALGIAGLVLPALPGPPLLFAGLFCAAWADRFVYVSWPTLLILGVLTLLTYVVDFAAIALGVRRFGASKRAVIGAAIASVVGVFIGLPGVLLGPFIGGIIGELSTRSGLQAATRAGIGATIGLVLGVIGKLALAFWMLGIFAIARFF